MADDFEWSRDNEDIVINWQGAIAVYQNKDAGIVVRQEGHGGDDDQFVVIRPEHLEKLIERMREVAAEAITDVAIERAKK